MKTITFEITEEQERMIRTGQITPRLYANSRTGKLSLQWGCIPAKDFNPALHYPELQEQTLPAKVAEGAE